MIERAFIAGSLNSQQNTLNFFHARTVLFPPAVLPELASEWIIVRDCLISGR
jgi:hypothetical protein